MVVREIDQNGEMKPVAKSDRKRLKGHLPFYSVDTPEEAAELVEAAVLAGEFFRRDDGVLIETSLAHEQTLEKLTQAGERLAVLHAGLQRSGTETD